MSLTLKRVQTAAISGGITWHSNKPTVPVAGDCYYEHSTHEAHVWDGHQWLKYSGQSHVEEVKRILPTQEELDRHPSLKSAWEEYLVVRKLLGL